MTTATRLVFSTLLALAATHALAVNKCTGADGKISFQDTLCSELSATVPSDKATTAKTGFAGTAASSPTPPLKNAANIELLRRERSLVLAAARNAATAAKERCEADRKRTVGTVKANAASQENSIVSACETHVREMEGALGAAQKLCAEVSCSSTR